MIAKFCGTPIQLFADGVTVMVAVFTALVALVAVNDNILPVPLAASPIDTSLFVQLYVAPLTELPKSTSVLAALLHIDWLP